MTDFDERRQRMETEIANAIFLSIPIEWDDARLEAEAAAEGNSPALRVSIIRELGPSSIEQTATIGAPSEILSSLSRLFALLRAECQAVAMIACEVSRPTGEEWTFEFRYRSAQ